MRTLIIYALLFAICGITTGCRFATCLVVENGTSDDILFKTSHTGKVYLIPSQTKCKVPHTKGKCEVQNGSNYWCYTSIAFPHKEDEAYQYSHSEFYNTQTLHIKLMPTGQITIPAASVIQPIGFPIYPCEKKFSADICIILVDSLRADHLGCYGYGRDTSPAVDAFAEDAVRFDQAIASGSWTQPSIMSMMASVPADVHQRVHWGRPHSTNVVTLAETLQKAGYQTVGLVANPMTNRKYGFARGFDFYDDWSLTGAPDATTGDIARQTAQGAKLTRLAQDWIERRRVPEMPLFLFVHYIDVHWDYLPPPPFNRMFAPDPIPPPRDIWNLGRASVPEAARRRSVAAYDGEIRYTDSCISNLLATLEASPRGKDTIVVICSDHGESFWERGVASHGNGLYEEEIRVPLIIRPACGDGAPAPGRVVTQQVGLIDLAPTLTDLVDVPAPTNWVGRSLAPALRGETLPEVPIVLDNRIGDDGAILRGARTSRWKVLAGPPHDRPTELYNLRTDPMETNNLIRTGSFSLPPEVEALLPLLKPTK